MLVDAVLYQKIHTEYDTWLVGEGRTRSRESGGIFSTRMTNFGTSDFHGLSEKQLNEVVDGDHRYAD
jgi:hypothetical protein